MKILSLLFISAISLTAVSQSQRETELLKIADEIRNDPTGSKVVQGMKPGMDDFQKIFKTTNDVGDMWMYTEEMYMSITDGAIEPGTHRTETRVVKVSGADLQAGAEHELPGGYNGIADKFKPGVLIYGLKFVEPGKDSGYSLNAFFYVNNHWVCIPKPWRGFE